MANVYTKKFPYMKKLFVSPGLTTTDILELFEQDWEREDAAGRSTISIPYPTLYTWGAKCRGKADVGWGIPKWAETRAKRVWTHYENRGQGDLFESEPITAINRTLEEATSPYPGKLGTFLGDVIIATDKTEERAETAPVAAGSFSLVAKDGSDLNLNDAVAMLRLVAGKTIKSINVEF